MAHLPVVSTKPEVHAAACLPAVADFPAVFSIMLKLAFLLLLPFLLLQAFLLLLESCCCWHPFSSWCFCYFWCPFCCWNPWYGWRSFDSFNAVVSVLMLLRSCCCWHLCWSWCFYIVSVSLLFLGSCRNWLFCFCLGPAVVNISSAPSVNTDVGIPSDVDVREVTGIPSFFSIHAVV